MVSLINPGETRIIAGFDHYRGNYDPASVLSARLPMTEHRIVSRDDVVPTDIEHKCEEHFAGEELDTTA